jgi:hypothetical protein
MNLKANARLVPYPAGTAKGSFVPALKNKVEASPHDSHPAPAQYENAQDLKIASPILAQQRRTSETEDKKCRE